MKNFIPSWNMGVNRLLVGLFALLLSSLLHGQEFRYYYRIDFKDKIPSTHSLTNPTTFLSEKAINRRVRQNIPIETSDLPISRSYASKVLQLPEMNFIAQSKWYNFLVVGMQDTSVLSKLRKEDFVKKIRQIPGSTDKAGLNFQQKMEEEVVSVQSVNDNSSYGAAFNQLNMLNGLYLHDRNYKGSDMLIAVIDAGFIQANTMPATQKARAEGRIIAGFDFVDKDSTLYEKSTHGSYVLSTMAAYDPRVMIGTAPESTYLLLRTEDSESEYLLEEYFWLSAAEFADSAGADILTTSLGYTRFDEIVQDHTYSDMDGNTTIITKASDFAASKGMLVVNSAGNSGNGDWYYIGAPADGDSVLAVGAVDERGAYAEFSSKGPSFDGRTKPNVAAQGFRAILAGLEGGAFAGSGTSFSAPILSGLAACLWQGNPNASNMDIFRAIERSGSLYNKSDDFMGHGIPDFAIADFLLRKELANSTEQEFLVFPNPFTDRLNILTDLKDGAELKLVLYNFKGELIREMVKPSMDNNLQSFHFSDLDALRAGLYLLVADIDGWKKQFRLMKE